MFTEKVKQRIFLQESLTSNTMKASRFKMLVESQTKELAELDAELKLVKSYTEDEPVIVKTTI